ncbi:hypothetical protein PO909_022054 [Leuciscus waleckii]
MKAGAQPTPWRQRKGPSWRWWGGWRERTILEVVGEDGGNCRRQYLRTQTDHDSTTKTHKSETPLPSTAFLIVLGFNGEALRIAGSPERSLRRRLKQQSTPRTAPEEAGRSSPPSAIRACYAIRCHILFCLCVLGLVWFQPRPLPFTPGVHWVSGQRGG